MMSVIATARIGIVVNNKNAVVYWPKLNIFIFIIEPDSLLKVFIVPIVLIAPKIDDNPTRCKLVSIISIDLIRNRCT